MPEDTAIQPADADPQMAEKYVDWLIDLMDKDKLVVNHSDLDKFDLDCMEDHYRINLKNYDVELSHSKHPKSGEDVYMLIFNNIAQIKDGQEKPVVLSYAHITADQFTELKQSADPNIQRRWQAEREKKFKEAMKPIDEVLDHMSDQTAEDTQAPEEHEANNLIGSETTELPSSTPAIV